MKMMSTRQQVFERIPLVVIAATALLLAVVIGADGVMAQPAEGAAEAEPDPTPAPASAPTPVSAPTQAPTQAPTSAPNTDGSQAPESASDAPLTAEQIAELDACRALANKSNRLRGQLKNDLRPDIQEADAAMTVRNKRHVIMAYAALWILTVGFLVLLFVRQRRLLAEIDGLRKEVADAVD